MSASPLSATPVSSINAASINASSPALAFDDATPVSSFKSVSPISSLGGVARSGAASFLPADEDVQARPEPLQDKRSLLLKHIAQSERLAEVRPASRLEARPRPEMISSGVAEVDAITGGIPRGCLTEIWGGASSGKTSLMLAAISAATSRGETCVLIDASDSFDPASAEAAGVNFGRMLWVRCGEKKWSAAFGRETPSHTRCASHAGNGRRLSAIGHQKNLKTKSEKSSERRLEQVLKATDLILQSGGFGMIVLDLAGIEEKFVRRIPLASWFRLQRAVEHTKSALIVVSETPCAQTCATLGLRVGKKPSAVSRQRSVKPEHAELLEDMRVQAEVTRSRLERKPMQSVRANFETQAARFG